MVPIELEPKLYAGKRIPSAFLILVIQDHPSSIRGKKAKVTPDIVESQLLK
jgi:hypothetical protein